MDYSFELNWGELNSDLREAKINSYIEYNYNNGNYVNENGENELSLDELLEDQGTRNEAEDSISNYFPMYF